jgi:hypothetical protein
MKVVTEKDANQIGLGTEFGSLYNTATDPGCMSQLIAFVSLYSHGSPFSMPQHSI